MKESITLSVEEFVNLYINIKHEQELSINNRLTVSEIITQIINDNSGMMFDSWCRNIDVMN